MSARCVGLAALLYQEKMTNAPSGLSSISTARAVRCLALPIAGPILRLAFGQLALFPLDQKFLRASF